MADLKTTYQDDVLDTSVNEKRKYNMIQNADGTVSFEDVTVYSQVGDSFGSSDVNEITGAINGLNNNLTANEQQFKFSYQDGKYGYMAKVEGADTFFPFNKGGLMLCADGCAYQPAHTNSAFWKPTSYDTNTCAVDGNNIVFKKKGKISMSFYGPLNYILKFYFNGNAIVLNNNLDAHKVYDVEVGTTVAFEISYNDPSSNAALYGYVYFSE